MIDNGILKLIAKVNELVERVFLSGRMRAVPEGVADVACSLGTVQTWPPISRSLKPSLSRPVPHCEPDGGVRKPA